MFSRRHNGMFEPRQQAVNTEWEGTRCMQPRPCYRNSAAEGKGVAENSAQCLVGRNQDP